MVDISDNTKWFQTDASNNIASPNGFPEGMAPSGVNDSNRMVMGALKRFYDHIGGVQTSAGSANAQTLTYTIAPTAYVAGDCYAFIVGASLTNTGATTLNVNGLGAKNIWLAGNALVGGEIQAGHIAVVRYDGTQFQLTSRAVSPAAAGFTPADPTGTTSATAVHMGLGSTATITPRVTGQLLIEAVGDMGTATTAGSTFTAQLRYGTGTAPVNGAAVTGTVAGSVVAIILSGYTANDRIPIALKGHVSSLTVGTAYWFDVALTTSSGTLTIKNVSIVARETAR